MRFECPWGVPHPSRHARERYIQRARDDRFRWPYTNPDDDDVAIAVLDAYQNGTTLTPPHGQQADVVVYSHGRNLILLRRDTDITTVFNPTAVTERTTLEALERAKRERRQTH
jgi:hypothetical protein